jgi:hypothetical protein
MTRQQIRQQIFALISARHAHGERASASVDRLFDHLVGDMHNDRVVASQVTAELLSLVDAAMECLAARDGEPPAEVWGRMRDDLVLLDIVIAERFLEPYRD